MNDRKEKLQKELEHLEKARKAGIIDDSEYLKSKARVDSKLADIEDQIKESEEKNRAVSDIIDSAKEAKVEIVDIPEDTYGVIIEEEEPREQETSKQEASKEDGNIPDEEPEEAHFAQASKRAASTEAPMESTREEREEVVLENPDKEDMEDVRAVDESKDDDAEETEDEPKKGRFDDDDDEEELDRPQRVIPKAVRIKKLKKKKVEEDKEPFNWGPVVAIAAFLIIAGAVFIAIRSSSAPPTLPADEPSFNTIEANNLRIQLEGITVPIEVYSDYTCSPCKATRENLKRLSMEYGKAIEIEYMNFPLSADLNASIAAECAKKQSMFDSFADRLYDAPVSDPATLKLYARELGLNLEQFSGCLDNMETKDKIIADYLHGVQKGVKGTPTIFMHDKQVSGYKDYQQLKELVEFQLA
jgi:predicted DsbA family dithiol-disulfide isomerase